MKKIFYVALAAMTMVACNDKKSNDTDPEQPQGGDEVTITLPATGTVEVGATLQLVATVDPAGTAITWSSNKPDIAEVDENGWVTGVAQGIAKITATAGDASASCTVAVTQPGEGGESDMAKYLEGTDYFLFALDGITYDKIADRVHENGDFRINGDYVGAEIPEEVTSVLQYWPSFPGSLVPGEGGGLNSFGENEGYISLISSSETVQWNGGSCGIIQVHRTVDLTAIAENPAEYTLVITYKTPASNSNSVQMKFTLYSTNEAGAKPEITVPGNTGGEWVVVEKPMSELFSQGLNWSQPYVWSGADGAMAFFTLGLLIDGGYDQGLDVDAAFIYKKPAEGEE
jgi:hypothetical protein